MIEVLQSILSLVVTLGILVTIHEYGHFWVARKCGVKVLRFSVGFGKPIYSWTDKQGTEYALASIPLGGYVKMLDEREAPVPEELKSFAFNNKPVSQRIAIASAGPIANFLFAIFAYWLMFLSGFNVLIPEVGGVNKDSIADKAGLKSGYEIVRVDDQATPGWRFVNLALVNRIGESGEITLQALPENSAEAETFVLSINDWLKGETQTNLVNNLGIETVKPHVPAIIGRVLSESPAAFGGMLPGDEIISADGVEVRDWYDFVKVIKPSANKILNVEVLRESGSGGQQIEVLTLKPGLHVTESGEEIGRLGVGPKPVKFPEEMIRQVSYGPLDAVPEALDRTWADTKMTLVAIKKMIIGLVSLDNLSGPITIAQVANQTISSGFEDFLSFLALLSVSLGVLNLLPIPVLDGGHILYYAYEALRGKPMPDSVQTFGLKIGLSLILMLMVLAFYNDLMRL